MKKQYALVVLFVLFLGLQMNVAPKMNNTTMTDVGNPVKMLGKLSSTVTTVSSLTLNNSVITSYASSGTGTSTDPYIVSNYVITNGKTAVGLTVSGLTVYVTIQNFTIHDTTDGIHVSNSAHITFNDTTVYNTVWGIIVFSGSYLSITNGNFSYNSYGITVDGTLGYDVISGNVLHNNNYGGYLYTATADTITNNHAFNNSIGIVVSSSNSNNISNNDVYSNPIGIEIHSGNYNYLTNNTVSQSSEYGFHIFLGSNYNNIDRNTISTSGINNVLVNESSYNNITGNTFVSDPQAHIKLGNQSVSNTINNNVFENAPVGINDNNASNLLVSSNSFNGVLDGVDAVNTNTVTVFNNSYTVNGYSTQTETAVRLTNVNGFNILNNNIYYSYNGLIISSSSKGNISYNSFTTMYSYVITLTSSTNINLSRNYFANEYYSVFTTTSSNNILFEYNFVKQSSSSNSDLFWEFQSSTIIFKYNDIVINGGDMGVIYYPTLLNFTYNSFYGIMPIIFRQFSVYANTVNFKNNYYATYTGTDANNDGIGDTPYIIYSTADNFPLMTSPSLQINVTSTKTIVQNSASDKVSFDLDSYFNGTYTVEVNSVVQFNGSTVQAQPLNILATIPNSKVTTVNVTITLKDQYQYSRVLTTIVDVVPSSGPVITGPSNYTYDGSNLLPAWNVSDQFLQSVEILVNGSSVYSANISSSETFTLPQTLSLQPGTYIVKVIATDTYNNSVEFTTTLTVANSGSSGNTVTVTVSAQNTGSLSSSGTSSTPGFEILFTALGMLALALVTRKKYKK